MTGPTMRAVVCRAWGTPEDLTVEDVAAPTAGPGEVRIAVAAAGVNFADTLLIAGKYQEKPDFPFTPGMEIAGEVVACGAGVEGFAAGDRVMAGVGVGGFAEQRGRQGRRCHPHARRHELRASRRLLGDLRHGAYRARPPRQSRGRRDAAGARRGPAASA